MLHIVKNSAALELASTVLSSSDELILLEDAVYLTHFCTKNASNMSFVLREDLLARGVSEEQVVGVKVIDFDGFVQLTENHESSLTWE